MGQRRIDREWPAPRNTRHIWLVTGEDRVTPPVQGLVVAWRRRSYKWSALVVRVDESVPDGRLIQEWVPVERIRPVRSDPNHVLRYSGFSELLRPRGNSRGTENGGT